MSRPLVMRLSLVMVFAALTACGGGDGTPAPADGANSYTVGGTISGLAAGSTLMLTDNGGTPYGVASNGAFTFPTALNTGSVYAVAIATQPASQTCTVQNGSGKIDGASVSSVTIACGESAADLPSLTVNPSTVSVSATTDQAAPTSLITATIANPGSAKYYFSQTFTTTGLASVSSPTSGSSGGFTLQFRDPTTLAPGTYTDTVSLEACEDSACQRQIKGSPVSVTVTYVTSSGPGTPPQLSLLGPNAVDAGGGAFQLIVTGSNFDAYSVIQWNGVQQPTSYLSSTLLVASISAQNVAVGGSVAVTVAKLDAAGTTVSNGLPFAVSTSSLAPTLVLSTRSITSSSDTSLGGGSILYNPLVMTVNGPTAGTYYYSISFTGSAVSNLFVNGSTGLQSGITIPSGPTAGRITGEPNGGLGQTITGTFGATLNFVDQILFVGATNLGAGTYADTITINVCTDALCSKPIAGSPQTVAVSYTVTGNSISTAQFTLGTSSLLLEAPTSGTAPVGTAVISTNGLPPYGAYVFPSIGSGNAIAGVSVQSNLNGTATLSVTAKPPASVGSGIYSDSVQLQICYDSACTKPASNTPLNIQVTYVVDASPGIDFTETTVPVQVSDMAWNATRQRIYATADSDEGGIAHSLLVINPMTASIEQTVSLGQGIDPIQIALSDDGRYAYILNNNASVLRVDLATLMVDETVTVAAGTVKAVPGEPGSFAIETTTSNDYANLVIYDGTTARPQSFTLSTMGIFMPFTFGADASTAYAYDSNPTQPILYQLSVSNSGLAVARQDSTAVLGISTPYDLEYSGGLIYAPNDVVYNPTTQTLQPSYSFLNSNPGGSVVLSSTPTIDTSLNRAYFETSDTPNVEAPNRESTLQGFNLTTRAPTWIARFPTAEGRLIRWGSNGLAFVGGSGGSFNVTLISGSLISR